MTPEQLLDMDAEALALLSDEQLLEYFQPVLDQTRPQLDLSKPKEAKVVDLDQVKSRGRSGVVKAKSKSILEKIEELKLQYGVTTTKQELPKELR